MSKKDIAALILWIPTIICGVIILFQWQFGRDDKKVAVAEAQACNHFAVEEFRVVLEDLCAADKQH
jgi:hypothetical protein